MINGLAVMAAALLGAVIGILLAPAVRGGVRYITSLVKDLKRRSSLRNWPIESVPEGGPGDKG